MSSTPPPVSTLQTIAPAELDHLIARCRAKDPDDRWQSARDVALQLAWIAEARPSQAAAAVTRSGSRERIAWAIAGVALAALIGAVAVIGAGGRAPAPVTDAVQSTLLPPANVTFGEEAHAQTLSPDGRQIAFVGSGADGVAQLWIRRLDGLSARAQAFTEGAQLPFWSPDSRSIGFFAGGKLKRMDVAGGPPQTLADAPFPLGGSWSRDGVIVFGGAFGVGLSQVPATGGAVTLATTFDPATRNVAHVAPSFLPDGRHFFFVAGTSPLTGNLYVGSIDSKDTKLVVRTNAGAMYAPTGHVLFLRESALMAQPFDLATLSTRGEAVAVADGVGRFLSALTFSVSANGTLVSRPGSAARTRLLWVNRRGETQEEAAPA